MEIEREREREIKELLQKIKEKGWEKNIGTFPITLQGCVL